MSQIIAFAGLVAQIIKQCSCHSTRVCGVCHQVTQIVAQTQLYGDIKKTQFLRYNKIGSDKVPSRII